MAATSIPGRLLEQGKRRGDMPAWYEKRGGEWIATDYATYSQLVRVAARALLGLGLQPGGSICILSGNRSEWVVADVACMMVGGVPAGIYETCSAEEVAYILSHSEALLVVVEDRAQLEKVRAHWDANTTLGYAVLLDGSAAASDDPRVLSWQGFLDKAESVDDAAVDTRLSALEDAAPGTYIYTSGTTGPPKAVMLSHENICWTASKSVELIDLGPGDSALSYLPLSHIAEQMFTIHAPITAASCVYFAEGRDQLASNLKEVQPTVLFGVPRVWEKFHVAVTAKLAEATGTKARLLDWAQDVGRRMAEARNEGKPPGAVLRLQHQLADRLVYSRLKPLLGLGAARLCVSGAAPIRPEILTFFSGLDVVIREVYGQSEDTGPTSFNVPGRTRFGTVGPVFPDVEVQIAEDGEILVRGPNVFLGYFKDPEATARSLVDGWLHSGDLGRMDEDGFLHITGRKKDIIITAGGKNITPRNIEEALQSVPLVSQAVVIGDERPYLSALLTLEPEAAARFAEAEGVASNTVHECATLHEALQRDVDQVNTRFARVETIKRFTVLPRELSVEGGELTPTLKIKRRAVASSWSSEIERMYASDQDPQKGIASSS